MLQLPVIAFCTNYILATTQTRFLIFSAALDHWSGKGEHPFLRCNMAQPFTKFGAIQQALHTDQNELHRAITMRPTVNERKLLTCDGWDQGWSSSSSSTNVHPDVGGLDAGTSLGASCFFLGARVSPIVGNASWDKIGRQMANKMWLLA